MRDIDDEMPDDEEGPDADSSATRSDETASGAITHLNLSRLTRLFNSAGRISLITLASLILFGAALYPAVVRIVPSGSAGVLYKPLANGTITDRVFQEGVHVKYPWDSLFVYDIRIQTILHEFTVLTNKGLPVRLKIAIRFRPERELVGLLQKNVGPNYPQVIVINQIESVFRRRLGLENPEDIYTNQAGILTSVYEDASEEAGQRFVNITEVLIREVVLPQQVAAAIEEKLVYQQNLEAYVFRLELQSQEANRLRIEARGIHDYLATIKATLSRELLAWQGIQATIDLAKSVNSKVIVIGAGDTGLPIILGDDAFSVPAETASPSGRSTTPTTEFLAGAEPSEQILRSDIAPGQARVADGALSAAEFLSAPLDILP